MLHVVSKMDQDDTEDQKCGSSYSDKAHRLFRHSQKTEMIESERANHLANDDQGHHRRRAQTGQH